MKKYIIDSVLDNETLYAQFRCASRFDGWHYWATEHLSEDERKEFIIKNFTPQFKTNFDLDIMCLQDMENYLVDFVRDVLYTFEFGCPLYDNFCRYYNSQRAKKKRTNSHIAFMTEYINAYELVMAHNPFKILFLTFTFNDYYYNKLDRVTMRRYVVKWLNQDNIIDYVGNVDYGKENERMHYHVLVLANGKLDFSSWENKYGYLKSKRYNYQKNRVTNYIEKLANHEVKIKANNVQIKDGKQVNVNKLSCHNKKYDKGIIQFMYGKDINDILEPISDIEELPF